MQLEVGKIYDRRRGAKKWRVVHIRSITNGEQRVLVLSVNEDGSDGWLTAWLCDDGSCNGPGGPPMPEDIVFPSAEPEYVPWTREDVPWPCWLVCGESTGMLVDGVSDAGIHIAGHGVVTWGNLFLDWRWREHHTHGELKPCRKVKGKP